MGIALCLLSAGCFGAMAIFGKFAYAAGVAPGALLLVRFALAAGLLAMLLLLRPDLRREPGTPRLPSDRSRLPAGLVWTALGLGAVGYATQASLYFAALQVMDASLLSLILYTYPLLVTVTAVALGRDRFSRPRLAALLAASCGALLVLLGGAGAGISLLGAALAFGSALTYTAYIMVADTVVHRLPPVVLAALVMTGAAVTLTARALVTGGLDLDFAPGGWFWIACVAIVSTVMPMLSFFAGLRITGPSSAAILSTFEPVVTTGLAALTLNEVLAPTQLLGGLLVVSAVVLLQARPDTKDRAAARGMPEPGLLTGRIVTQPAGRVLSATSSRRI